MIILLGYMGSGKSSVGEYLNRKHNLSYCDLDNYIEKQEHKTIADIFKSEGEIYFRKIESQYLKEILKKNAVDVLSLGGGTPCYAGNMDIIKQHNAQSFYLKVDLKTLTQRLFLQKEERPLIAGIDSEDTLKDFIRKHLFEREFYYRQAHHIIDTTDLSVDMTAIRILDH